MPIPFLGASSAPDNKPSGGDSDVTALVAKNSTLLSKHVNENTALADRLSKLEQSMDQVTAALQVLAPQAFE